MVKYLDVECYPCGLHVLRSYLEGTPLPIVLGFTCARCGGKVRPIAPSSEWERRYGWGKEMSMGVGHTYKARRQHEERR